MRPGVLQLWMMGEGPLQGLCSDPRGSRLIFSMIYAGRTFPRGLGWPSDVTSRLQWDFSPTELSMGPARSWLPAATRRARKGSPLSITPVGVPLHLVPMVRERHTRRGQSGRSWGLTWKRKRSGSRGTS